MSHVYVISHEAWEYSRAVKIGYSRDVDARIADLNACFAMSTGRRGALRLIVKTDGERWQEAAVHRLFWPHRMASEWFKVTPRLRGFVDALCSGVTLEDLLRGGEHAERVNLHVVRTRESRAKSRRVSVDERGSIYRRKWRNADGSVRVGETLWIKYRLGGRLMRESTRATSDDEAREILRSRVAIKV